LDPDPDPLVRGTYPDPDPHQNVTDPQHCLKQEVPFMLSQHGSDITFYAKPTLSNNPQIMLDVPLRCPDYSGQLQESSSRILPVKHNTHRLWSFRIRACSQHHQQVPFFPSNLGFPYILSFYPLLAAFTCQQDSLKGQ
jgi:hypothetical protein